MKVLRVATLSLVLLLVVAAAYPCQPAKYIEYYSDYFVTMVGYWSCTCEGYTYQTGQQSGAYKRVTTVGCHIGQETETCYEWTGSTWIPIDCP